METSHQSPLERIASKAHWAERFFLVVLIAGVGLRYGGMQMMPLIYLGLVGLAITYFLFAFRVPDVPRPENGKEEKFGFYCKVWPVAGTNAFEIAACCRGCGLCDLHCWQQVTDPIIP